MDRNDQAAWWMLHLINAHWLACCRIQLSPSNSTPHSSAVLFAMMALRRHVNFWPIVSLIALCVFVFWPTLQYDYVNWDDPAYIWFNELITSWSLANLSGIATETVTRNYAPLTILSYLIDHTFWGMNPGGYHFSNILLHALNGALVFVLIRQLTGNRATAWLTAALFLIHPIQLETVAWISSRKGLLSGAFMLAAVIVRTRKERRAADDAWYIGWLAAALLSKALAVVVPPIVLLYDVLVRRERFADAFVRQVIPGFLSLLLLLHTMGAQNSVLGGVRGHMSLPLWQILVVDMTILARYIRMMCWPSDLCVLYDPPTSGIFIPAALSTLAWGVFTCWTWRRRHQQPLLLLGLAAFLLLLFPVLNFFRITTLMNDRYLNLPSIAFFALFASMLHQGTALCVERLGRIAPKITSTSHSPSIMPALLQGWITSQRILSTTLALATVVAAIAVTRSHLPVWQDSLTLWSHTRVNAPQLAVVRIQMALTLDERGYTEEAMRELLTALRDCDPDEGDEQRIQLMLEEWSMAM
ncbi:MAG: hypothetical protein KDA85_20965, partial [Planctomycetaceae bacterium]|nr:hypothetical protein [Planctomycetaceae bacterium]